MKRRQEDLPILVVTDGELKGKRWILDEGEFNIGRDQTCDLSIPDRQVSRYHARIQSTEKGYILTDLGSKNGTHLNGARIEDQVLLQDGDEIQVAVALKLVYVGTESTIPLTVEDVTEQGIGRLRMEIQAHRVWVHNKEIEPPLSPPQFRLLELLYEHPGRVVARDKIASHVWPGTEGVGVSDQAIDALVRRLRDRLSDLDPEYEFIITIRGHGFRLKNQP
jgi:pSer/pThr/pTyr-binding forkhead associated (FHA) protein